ncbi:MAG TPA: hypothetical protein VI072_03860 [Polyangiaceae bacterium]
MSLLVVGTVAQGKEGNVTSCNVVLDERRDRTRIAGKLIARCNTHSAGISVLHAAKVISQPPDETYTFNGDLDNEQDFLTGYFARVPSGSTLTVHVEADCTDGKGRLSAARDCKMP